MFRNRVLNISASLDRDGRAIWACKGRASPGLCFWPCLFSWLSRRDPGFKFEEVNPLCGDRIRVELRLEDNCTLKAVRFSGEMCAIVKASASILFGSLDGMTLAAITDISDDQVLENLGGPIDSNRVKCALLPVIALRGAIRSSDGHAT